MSRSTRACVNAIARLPDSPARTAAIEKFDARRNAAWPEPLRKAGLLKNPAETRAAYTLRIVGALEAVFVPNLARPLERETRARTLNATTRTRLETALLPKP